MQEKTVADFLRFLRSSDKLVLTDAQIILVEQYYAILLEWNQKMNLTKLTEPCDFAVKHIYDSLLCYDERYFAGERVADVGTGAGFPAIPLKIKNDKLKMTLIDSLRKRLDFLQAVSTELGLSDVECRHMRAEDAGRTKGMRECFDVVTARAVARLNILCEYCLPLLKVGGIFVALKSTQYREELVEAERALKVLGGEVVEIKFAELPIVNEKRSIFYIKKVKKTLAEYPRKYSSIEKKPL